MDIFESFLSSIEESIKHATPKEMREIKAELRAHLEDHTAALVDSGRSKGEAKEAAVKAMGKPEEIGKAYDAELPNFWYTVRVLANLVTAFALLFFLIFVSFSMSCDLRPALNIGLTKPFIEAGYTMENTYNERLRIPNSTITIRFVFSQVEETADGDILHLGVCVYNQNIFDTYNAFAGDYTLCGHRRDEIQSKYIPTPDINAGFNVWSVPIDSSTHSIKFIRNWAGAYRVVELPLERKGDVQ